MIISSFYKVGGCLQVDAANYVIRQADIELDAALQAREFCYVFSSRQMGKSSLLIRAKAKLQQSGARCVYLDMTRLGSNGLTQQQWYTGIGVSLLQSLECLPRINFTQWWQARSQLPLVQRLNQLVEEILVADAAGPPVYIFIDEIDGLLSLDFSTDDFFAWMRSCYNQRAQDPRYRRLTFALFGVATPSDLIADKQRTPFNIGQAIALQGFTLDESEPLQAGLTPFVNSPQAVLKAILTWTGGQPFLTQRLCQIVVNAAQPSDHLPLTLLPGAVENWIDGLVRSHLLVHWESQDEPIHLRTIRDHLFWHRQRTGRILGIYQQLLQAETVATDDSREQSDLRLSGLVVSQGSHLAIKNRIYREVFTFDWVRRQLRQLRPYAAAFDGWIASEHKDDTYLLRGQALVDAEQWSRDKSLSDLDYQFLSASQDAERQHIQQLLDAKAESERFFRQLAEAVPQMVWIVQPDGTLSYSNQQSSQFSGQPMEDFQGWQRLNVIHPDDRDRSLAAWQTSLETGKPYEIQLRLQDAQGDYRWFLNRAVPIRDATGQVVKWFGTSTDLDDIKRAADAKRLQEVEKRLQQEQRVGRLQRWLLGTVSVALLIALGLGAYAFGQQRQANLREIEALANASEAQFASGNRLDALVTAIAAQARLTHLAAAPSTLTTKVERELRRATFQAIEFNRLNGNKGRVYGIAISPDGKQIAASHQQSAISLWGADGQLQQTLEGHEGEVNDVEFSPDGQMLVSGGRDGTVRLWSREGDLLETFQGHQNHVVSIDISPDSNWIASASEDGTVKLWSTTGQLAQTLTDHDGAVWDVAFSPNGQWLASAGWDDTVILWQADGTKVRTFKNPIISDRGTNRLISVVFSPDGQTLVAGDWKGNIVWWQVDGTLIDTATEHPSSIVSLTFSPDGQTLVSGSWDSTIKLWNRDRVVTRTLMAHPTGTWEVAFTADGQTLVSGGGDKLVRLWRPNPEPLTVLRGHRTSVWQVIMAPDCTIEAACPGGAAATLENPLIISSSTDGTAKIWSAAGRLLQTLVADQSEIWDVAISPNGATIATATHEGELTWWSRTGERLKTIQAHTDRFNDLEFSPDGAEIASASWDGTVKRWHSDGTLLQVVETNQERLNAVAYSPDNQWLVTAGRDKIARLWHRDATGQFSGQPQFELSGHQDTIWDIAFSPDSQVLATASEDSTIKLWSFEGNLIRTIDAHDDLINSITFIPSNAGLPAEWGTVLASASWDKTVKLWSLDGTLRLTLEGHEERALDVAFHAATSTQGPLLASAGLDDVVILWPLDDILQIDQVLTYGCAWAKDYMQTDVSAVAYNQQSAAFRQTGICNNVASD